MCRRKALENNFIHKAYDKAGLSLAKLLKAKGKKEDVDDAQDVTQEQADASTEKNQDPSAGTINIDAVKDSNNMKQLTQGAKILIGLVYYSTYTCYMVAVNTL